MKGIPKWLKNMLSRYSTTIEVNEHGIPVSVNPGNIEDSTDAEVPDQNASQARLQEVVMPDIYADKHDATEPDLKVLDEPLPEATGDTQPLLEIIDNPSRTSEMSEGFDPYNTGGFKGPKK